MRKSITTQIRSVTDRYAPTASWDSQTRLAVAREILDAVSPAELEGQDAAFVQLCGCILSDIAQREPALDARLMEWLATEPDAPLMLLVGMAAQSDSFERPLPGARRLLNQIRTLPLTDDEQVLLLGALEASRAESR